LNESKVLKADEAGLLKDNTIVNVGGADPVSKKKGIAAKFYKKIPLLSAHKFGMDDANEGAQNDARFSCDCQVVDLNIDGEIFRSLVDGIASR
jgi:hypothetical protein